MSDSSNPQVGSESLAGKVGRSLLLVSGYVIVKSLLKCFGPGVPDGALDAAATAASAITPGYLGGGISKLADGVAYIGGHVVAHKVAETLFHHGDAPATASGINHDIERALARSVARTIRILLAEWQTLNKDTRSECEEPQDLITLDEECRAFIDLRNPQDMPEIVRDWLENLGTAEFLDFPERGAAPWNDTVTGFPPAPPCSFSEWFHWRYPAAFRLIFADELANDELAREKFLLALESRQLDLAAQTSEDVHAIKTQLIAVSKHLHAAPGDWLSEFTREAARTLTSVSPEIAEAIAVNIRGELHQIANSVITGFENAEEMQRQRHRQDEQEHEKTRAELAEVIGEKSLELKTGLHDLASAVRALEPGADGSSDAQDRNKSRPPSWTEQIIAYKNASTRGFELLPIAGLGGTSEAQRALTLSGLYVEPAASTTSRVINRDSFDYYKKPPEYSKSHRESALLAITTGNHPHHVLLGDAGSGKSSVLRHIYIHWVRAFDAELAAHRNGSAAGPVPVLVEVREYLAARSRAADGQDANPIESILDYLVRPCSRTWHFERADLLDALLSGTAWLLVDGLDEAFDPAVRCILYDWLLGFARQYPSVRIIVSSRSFGFPNEKWLGDHRMSDPDHWYVHTLLPFDDPRIETFLDNWFGSEIPGVELSTDMRAELAHAIEFRPFLQPLARSPLTLTMLCAVGQRGVRPENRIKLYHQAVGIFIERWDNLHGLPLEKADIVREFASHGEEGRRYFFRRVAEVMLEKGNPNDSNQISRDALLAILIEYFKKTDRSNPTALAHGILDLICVRNFLLIERPGDTFAFFHRSFLEYFTAVNWVEIWKGDRNISSREYVRRILGDRWRDETWHETLRFLISMHDVPDAVAVLDSLATLDRETFVLRKFAAYLGLPERPRLSLFYALDFVHEVIPSVQTGRPTSGKTPNRNTSAQIAAEWLPDAFRNLGYVHSQSKTVQRILTLLLPLFIPAVFNENFVALPLVAFFAGFVAISIRDNLSKQSLRGFKYASSQEREEYPSDTSEGRKALSMVMPFMESNPQLVRQVLSLNFSPFWGSKEGTIQKTVSFSKWAGTETGKRRLIEVMMAARCIESPGPTAPQESLNAFKILRVKWSEDEEFIAAIKAVVLSNPACAPDKLRFSHVRRAAARLIHSDMYNDDDVPAASFTLVNVGRQDGEFNEPDEFVRANLIFSAILYLPNPEARFQWLKERLASRKADETWLEGSLTVRAEIVRCGEFLVSAVPECGSWFQEIITASGADGAFIEPSAQARAQAVGGMFRSQLPFETKKRLLWSLFRFNPDRDFAVKSEEMRHEAARAFMEVEEWGDETFAVIRDTLLARTPRGRHVEHNRSCRKCLITAISVNWRHLPDACSLLLSLLTSRQPDGLPTEQEGDVRSRIVDTLSKSWPDSHEVYDSCVRHLLETRADGSFIEDDWQVRDGILNAISKNWACIPRTRKVLMDLIDLTSQANKQHFRSFIPTAMSSLVRAHHGDPEVETWLCGLVTEAPDINRNHLRSCAIEALGKGWAGSPNAMHALFKVLEPRRNDDAVFELDAGIRSAAIDALAHGWKGNVEAKAALTKIEQGRNLDGTFLEPDEAVRLWARRHLASWDSPDEILEEDVS